MNRDDERLRRIKEGLMCTVDEAFAVLEYDKAVDRGEPTPYDLTPAQNEVARRYAHTGTRKTPTAYKFTPRERKPNEDKREIIQCIEDALCCLVDDVTVTNPERQIDFLFNDIKYRIVLSAPRK